MMSLEAVEAPVSCIIQEMANSSTGQLPFVNNISPIVL